MVLLQPHRSVFIEGRRFYYIWIVSVQVTPDHAAKASWVFASRAMGFIFVGLAASDQMHKLCNLAIVSHDVITILLSLVVDNPILESFCTLHKCVLCQFFQLRPPAFLYMYVKHELEASSIVERV